MADDEDLGVPEKLRVGKDHGEHALTIAAVQMLKTAYEKVDEKLHKEMQKFEKENPWVKDVIVFQAIKETEGQKAWWDWSDKALQKHDAKAVAAFEKDNRKLCDFYLFIQYIFYAQWTKLKEKINEIGISVIGDIPIYVSGDSL